MESIFTFVVLIASLQYAISDAFTSLLLKFIKTKPDIDPIDAKIEVRFLERHYRGR